jgi:hypothetical protein
MPLSLPNEAIIAEAKSGICVPKATKVKPITKSETPILFAIEAADLTKKSEPLTSRSKPSKNNKMWAIIFLV